MCQKIASAGREYVSRDSLYRIVSVGEINYTALIDFVQEELKRKKITPNRLAIQSGIPAQSLYRFLSGERGLVPSSITKLAGGLGIDPEQLHRLVPGGVLGELPLNEDPESKALEVQLLSRFHRLNADSRRTLIGLAEALITSAKKPDAPVTPTRPKGKKIDERALDLIIEGAAYEVRNGELWVKCYSLSE